MSWLGDVFDGFAYDHPAAILLYAAIAFAIGLWLGARSRTWEYSDGYRDGREDERSDSKISHP